MMACELLQGFLTVNGCYDFITLRLQELYHELPVCWLIVNDKDGRRHARSRAQRSRELCQTGHRRRPCTHPQADNLLASAAPIMSLSALRSKRNFNWSQGGGPKQAAQVRTTGRVQIVGSAFHRLMTR